MKDWGHLLDRIQEHIRNGMNHIPLSDEPGYPLIVFCTGCQMRQSHDQGLSFDIDKLVLKFDLRNPNQFEGALSIKNFNIDDGYGRWEPEQNVFFILYSWLERNGGAEKEIHESIRNFCKGDWYSFLDLVRTLSTCFVQTLFDPRRDSNEPWRPFPRQRSEIKIQTEGNWISDTIII